MKNEGVHRQVEGPDTQIDNLVKARIHTPIVGVLYQNFQDRGCADELFRLVRKLPEAQSPLVLHSLCTHVTREKAAWVTLFTPDQGVKSEDVAYMGATVELLWTAALIADDIEDNDTERASSTTVWAKYGKEDAFQTWNGVLDLLEMDMNKRYPDIQAGDLMRKYVNIGLKSLVEHRSLTLQSTPQDLELNYYRRAMFHADLPFSIIFRADEQKPAREVATQAVQLINNAGQMLNDLKDLVVSPITGRSNFGDIRNGVVTIPLKMLYDSARNEHGSFLSSIMETELNQEQINTLCEVISQHDLKKRVVDKALTKYGDAIRILSGVVPTSQLGILLDWVDYKKDQAYQLAS